jgi:hypothetical protein
MMDEQSRIQLVREWWDAKTKHEEAERAETEAGRALKRAEAALSMSLLPPDSKVGDVVALWIGRSMLAATAHTNQGGFPNRWSGPVTVRYEDYVDFRKRVAPDTKEGS